MIQICSLSYGFSFVTHLMKLSLSCIMGWKITFIYYYLNASQRISFGSLQGVFQTDNVLILLTFSHETLIK